MSKFNNPFDDIIFWINLALIDFDISPNVDENNIENIFNETEEDKNTKNIKPN